MSMTPSETSAAIFQTHRPVLFALAYHLLGSVMDAEDCVQEAFLRWQNLWLAGQAATVQSPRTYLCTIVTHLCIDQLRSARARREAYVGVWLPEPLLTTDDSADPTTIAAQAESLSLAFLRLLERLAPVERAVFVLHQAFGYEYSEIAEIVGKSEENCRQIGRRAQQHLAGDRARFNADAVQQARLTNQFIQTCATGDMDGLLALLSEDIVVHSDGGGKVRAALNPIIGPAHVMRFIAGILRKFPADGTFQIMQINGCLGVVLYENGAPMGVLVVAGNHEHITEIDFVVNPDKLRHIPPADPSQAVPLNKQTDD